MLHSVATPDGEPAIDSWEVVDSVRLRDLLLAHAREPAGRPLIVGVDGRGGGGKSTIAALLHATVSDSMIVHTDDIAWNEPYFEWAPLLAGGILEPLRRGRPVAFTPPAWTTHGRSGAITVAAGLRLVIVEGVGAAQLALSDLLDVIVWVQSDFAEAERRGIARDIAHGMNGDEAESVAFWYEWMQHERPFLQRERPWTRASLVICGTPPPELPVDEILVSSMTPG